MENGGIQRPSDARKHDYSDAIAIIGLHSNPKAIGDYSEDGLAIRSDDGTEKITLSQGSVDIDIAGTGGAIYNSDGSVVFKNGATITAEGDFKNADGTTFGTHVHAPSSTPPTVGS
jgi:hypothetical protein